MGKSSLFSNHFKWVLALFIFQFAEISLSYTQVIEVSCDPPQLIYNDHVGNEWSFNYEINGKLFGIDKPIQISTAQASLLRFVVFEANEEHPDKAFVSCNLDPANMAMLKEYIKVLEVTIKESNGRYAGNTANWSVRIYYKKVQGRT